VKLIGVLGSAAGKRDLEIVGPAGLRVEDLISRLLVEVNNGQFKELLIDSATGTPLPNVIMLLNDHDCNLFEGLKTRLESETLLTIIPVAHGG
jgi:molybdopterin converting factor small subunit